jgi:hypothetical protein
MASLNLAVHTLHGLMRAETRLEGLPAPPVGDQIGQGEIQDVTRGGAKSPEAAPLHMQWSVPRWGPRRGQ